MKKTTFVILCLEAAILSFNLPATAALIPTIAREFGISPFITGRIVWFYMIPYGIAALFYGPLIRLFDARHIKLVCLFCFSLANLLMGFSKNITALFMARFFMGIFGASVIPLALILIAQNIECSSRGKRVGIFFSTTFISPILGLFLSGIISWRLIYLIPAISGFILWINMYFYLPRFRQEKPALSINYLSTFKNKIMVSIFIYIFIISLLYHGIQQWLGVYFSQTLNLNQFVISMLITLTALSGIFGELIGGWFSDSLGRSKTINLGVVLMVLSIILLLLLKIPLFVLAIPLIIWGLGWAINHAGISTILTDLPKEFLNEAASLNSSMRFLSGGLGVVVGGWLMQKNFSLGFTIFGFSLLGLMFFSRYLGIGNH